MKKKVNLVNMFADSIDYAQGSAVYLLYKLVHKRLPRKLKKRFTAPLKKIKKRMNRRYKQLKKEGI